MGAVRRTFYDRTFTKMDAGSLRGSIFALCSAAIGAGVLSLPYVLALNGWLIGILFIFVGAIAANWSNKILVKKAVENDCRNYYSLCVKVGGKKLGMLLSCCILLYGFGVLISYQIIVTSLFKYACKKFGMSVETAETRSLSVYQAVPTAFLVFYPLSIKRDMSAFRYVSLCSLFALLYTGVVLIVELPSYYSHFSKISTIKAAYFDLNLFTGAAMTFFSYTC